MSQLVGLRELVESKYASIHAFCRAHPELSRTTVYEVVSGRYIGDVEAQALKIRAAVQDMPVDTPRPVPHTTPEAVAETLQRIRCGNCRRLDKRGCTECRTQTIKESFALYDHLFR